MPLFMPMHGLPRGGGGGGGEGGGRKEDYACLLQKLACPASSEHHGHAVHALTLRWEVQGTRRSPARHSRGGGVLPVLPTPGAAQRAGAVRSPHQRPRRQLPATLPSPLRSILTPRTPRERLTRDWLLPAQQSRAELDRFHPNFPATPKWTD